VNANNVASAARRPHPGWHGHPEHPARGHATIGGTLTIFQAPARHPGDVGTAGAAASLSTPADQLHRHHPADRPGERASTLTVTDGLGTSYGGLLIGAGQLVKDGPGTFTLSGTASNTNSG